VFARYILDQPTIWAYDTSLFLFGYISALGGAYAQQKNAHINVDIIHAKASENIRRLFDLITATLAIGFLIVMAKTCGDLFLESLELNYRTQSEWAPPVHHFWLMITISSIIFIAEYSTEFIANLFYLITHRELITHHNEPHSISLDEQPFKVDSTMVKTKETTEENLYGN